MKKFWRKMSLGLLMTFILTIFAPYSVLADEVLVPSLNKDANGNYTVSSVADLNTFRSDIDKGINYSGQHVVLTKDIDNTKDIPLNSFKTNKSFNGIFDGRFHTISNYTDPKSGLFGTVDKDGVVKNVRIDANVVIEDASSIISSKSRLYPYGIIANGTAGMISQCSSTGTIQNTGTIGNMYIAGIAGCDYTCFNYKTIIGEVKDCYSNVTFDNKVTFSSLKRAGICANARKSIEHCYFYGKFLGVDEGSLDGNPIMCLGGPEDATTCAYDKSVWQSPKQPSGNPVGYTTEEMKNKNSYTALGFDFDKTWKIDPDKNGGYPYLNPENIEKIPTRVTVDVQPIVADKPFDTHNSEDLKASVTEVKIVHTTQNEELISKYNVKASYSGGATFSAPTIGNVPVKINDSSKVTITCDDTKGDYQFILGNVLSASGKILDDGTPGPTADKQKEQIENAKKAQDILYSKLNVGQGDVTEFTWSGKKASSQGEEGTIIFITDVWEVFSSARSGYKGVRSGYYDDWFKSVQNGLKKMKSEEITEQDVKITEWQKLVLAITAIGYDPRDIEAYDLIDIISNKDYSKTSPQYFADQYAVFALNSYNYAVPQDGNRIDKEARIHEWAKNTHGATGADGSTVSGNTVGDMWVMAFQPIAAYYDPNAKEGDKYYDVKQAMEHAFDQFSNAQTYKGSFYGGYTYNNPWTNAQVYITLGMAHGDIFDEKYIKNGKSILDGALEFYNIKEGTTIFEKMTYEPTQMCRGLDSLVRSYEGRNSIFNCTDVKDSTVPVNNAIAALPNTITVANNAQVDAAQILYNALSGAKKASIKESTKAKLAAAQKAVDGEGKDDTNIDKTLEISNLTEEKQFKLDNDAKITIQAANKSDKAKKVTLIAGVYDNNGSLIKYGASEQNIDALKSVNLKVTLKLPQQGGCTVKAFICNGLEERTPISDIIEIPVVNK